MRSLTPARAAGAALLLAAVALVVLYLLPSNTYYVFIPDRAHALAPLVKIPGQHARTADGGVYFVDVRFRKARLLEDLLGRLRFLGVYLLSAVGGGVMYYFLAPGNAPAVGASGAIFGLFGAWFVVSRRLRLDTRGIAMLIAINLALSFFFHNIIAWQDHIGGLLTGVLLTAAYAYAPRKNRAALQVLATVAVVVLLVIAIAVRNGQLTGAGG